MVGRSSLPNQNSTGPNKSLTWACTNHDDRRPGLLLAARSLPHRCELLSAAYYAGPSSPPLLSCTCPLPCVDSAHAGAITARTQLHTINDGQLCSIHIMSSMMMLIRKKASMETLIATRTGHLGSGCWCTLVLCWPATTTYPALSAKQKRY